MATDAILVFALTNTAEISPSVLLGKIVVYVL